MKYLFVITAFMITISANSQARLNRSAQNIYSEFELDGIEYVNDSAVGLYLTFYPDPNILVNYYLNADSICTSVTVQTFTKEMTDFIISIYSEEGYLKTDTGWLMRSDYGISKIVHIIEEDNINIFFWY